MNLSTIFEEVKAERVRQDEKHPIKPTRLISSNTSLEVLEYMAQVAKERNDELELKGQHDYWSLIREELLEVITAKTREERHIEIVQAIALLVRLDEDTEVKHAAN